MTAPPPPTPRASGAFAAPVQTRRELDVFGSLRTHWLACLLIFAAAAIGFGYLAKQREAFTYYSTAALRVARSFPRTLQNDRELELGSSYDYDSFRNDQVALLLRSDVLLDALTRCGQLGPPWGAPGAPESTLTANFARSLTINAVPKSSRIEITLQSSQREVLQPALDALLDAFATAHRREYFFAEDERPQTLRTALAEVEQSIAAKRSEIEQLTTRLGVTNFGSSTTNPWIAAIELARQEHAEADRALERARLERQAQQAALSAPITPVDLLSGAVEWGEVSPGLQAILGALASRHTTLRGELHALGIGHPGRAALERELRDIEDRATQIRVSQVESLMLAADTAVREAEVVEAGAAQDLADLEARNADFLAGFQRGRILEDELPRDLSLRDRLNQRLEFFEFETQSPSYAEVVQEASEVDPQGESNLKRNLAIALFLALALALGLPVLWDLRDDRVHTPDDVRGALGIPLAGWLPRVTRVGAKKLHLSQAQRLAQAIDRDRRSHGARLLVFTGVQSDAALPVVRVIAEALCDLGRRVLVVDAIGGQPGEHAGNTGLLGLLAGDPLQVIPQQDDGDFLPRGTAAGGSADWDHWAQILSNAAATYDLVLVAAPGLLAAPAAELLVADADLSVLVVEAEDERLGEVGRAGQVLHGLKPKAVGAVLNNVRAFRSRGYYRSLA